MISKIKKYFFNRDIFWASFGNVTYVVFYTLSFILLARTLGAEAIGVFFLAQSIGMPLSLLCGLRYREILGTEKEISNLKEHIKAVLIVSIPVLFISLAIWSAVMEGTTKYVGLAIIISNVTRGMSEIGQGRFFRLKLFKPAALFEISRGLSTLISFTLGILVFNSFVLSAVLMAFTWLIILLLEIAFALKVSSSTPRFTTNDVGIIEKLRLAISYSLTIFQISSVRIIVSAILGEAALGIIGAASMVTKAVMPIGRAIASTLLAELGTAASSGDKSVALEQYRKINVATFAIICIFAVTGYVAVPPIIEALLGKDLRPSAALSCILTIGGAPLLASRFLIQILISFRQTVAIEKIAWISLFITIILSIPLTYFLGMLGAGLSLSAGYVFRYALAAYYVRMYC